MSCKSDVYCLHRVTLVRCISVYHSCVSVGMCLYMCVYVRARTHTVSLSLSHTHKNYQIADICTNTIRKPSHTNIHTHTRVCTYNRIHICYKFTYKHTHAHTHTVSILSYIPDDILNHNTIISRVSSPSITRSRYNEFSIYRGTLYQFRR